MVRATPVIHKHSTDAHSLNKPRGNSMNIPAHDTRTSLFEEPFRSSPRRQQPERQPPSPELPATTRTFSQPGSYIHLFPGLGNRFPGPPAWQLGSGHSVSTHTVTFVGGAIILPAAATSAATCPPRVLWRCRWFEISLDCSCSSRQIERYSTCLMPTGTESYIYIYTNVYIYVTLGASAPPASVQAFCSDTITVYSCTTLVILPPQYPEIPVRS